MILSVGGIDSITEYCKVVSQIDSAIKALNIVKSLE